MMATTTTSPSTTLKTPTRGRRGARTATKRSQFIPPAPLGSMLEQPTCSSESLSPPKASSRATKNKNNWGHLSLEQGLSIHEARNKALLEDGTSETSSSSSGEDDEVSDSQMIAHAPPPAHHHHHPFASSKSPPLRQESIQKFLDTMNNNNNTGGAAAAFDDIGELFDDITIASVGSVRSRSRSKSKHNKRSRSSNSKHNNRRSKSVGKHGDNSCRSTRSKSRESNNNNNSSHHGGRSSRAACKLSKALEKLEQINKQDSTNNHHPAPKTVTSHSRISRKGGGRTARTGRLVKSNEGLGQMAASIKRHARMMGSKDDSFKAELGEMPLQGSFGSLGNDPDQDDPLVAATGNRRSKSLHRTEQRRSRPSNSSTKGNNLAPSTRRRGDLKTRRLASSSSGKKGAEVPAPKERTVHRSKSDDLVLLTGGFSREKK